MIFSYRFISFSSKSWRSTNTEYCLHTIGTSLFPYLMNAWIFSPLILGIFILYLLTEIAVIAPWNCFLPKRLFMQIFSESEHKKVQLL